MVEEREGTKEKKEVNWRKEKKKEKRKRSVQPHCLQ